MRILKIKIRQVSAAGKLKIPRLPRGSNYLPSSTRKMLSNNSKTRKSETVYVRRRQTKARTGVFFSHYSHFRLTAQGSNRPTETNLWMKGYKPLLIKALKPFKIMHMEDGETSAPTILVLFNYSSRCANPPRCTTGILYLKIGVVVVRMFGFAHLDCHPRFLHELASRQCHCPQHALAAPVQDFL